MMEDGMMCFCMVPSGLLDRKGIRQARSTLAHILWRKKGMYDYDLEVVAGSVVTV
jgi:hypothetical protein